MWKIYTKKSDFVETGKKFNISPVIARILRNRDIFKDDDVKTFLESDVLKMHDPYKMKGIKEAVLFLQDKIKENKKIRIIGDYDIDGVCATTILYRGLKDVSANVDYDIPSRIDDGYGINISLIDKAIEDGVDTIITCDNGIAAINQIEYARKNNINVIVTDHHEVPFEIVEGEKKYILPNANIIINPHQKECNYPFKFLCGASVAYKLIEALSVSKEVLEVCIRFAAIATIGDVVSLVDENRTIVKHGLKLINKYDTKKITKKTIVGLNALIEQNAILNKEITTYHIGFVLGPQINATGRLNTAKFGVELFLEEDEKRAYLLAGELAKLNDERKELTEHFVKVAKNMVEKEFLNDDILVIYLKDCHESIAGIVAGRIKETYYKPTFVITDAKDMLKGSGRSIENYDMYENLNAISHLLEKYGGHKMAAGFSLKEENILRMRKELNKNCKLSDEMKERVLWIDCPLPIEYISHSLIEQIKVLEPFGSGNVKPTFVDKNLLIKSKTVLGKKQNILKLKLENEKCQIIDAIKFIDGENHLKIGDRINVVFYPEINEFNGNKSIQLNIIDYKLVND